jgi:hypothetical protein
VLRAVLLFDPGPGLVVGIDVALAVAEAGCTGVMSVPQVLGDSTRRLGREVFLGPPERGSYRVGLGGVGKVDHGLGKVELSFGQPDELDRTGRGVCD